MKKIFRKWRGPAAVLIFAAATLAAPAAPQVKTLGGGPNQTSPARAGNTDGSTFAFAKFNKPYSLALDTNGDLFVADYGNNKLRKVTKPGAADSLTSTFASSLPAPSGVAVDHLGAVYVVTQRDGKLRKFGSDGVLLRTVGGFRNPTAVALATNGTVFVAELGGSVYKVLTNDAVSIVASGFLRPRGLVVLNNGQLAVTESTGHAVRSLDPNTGTSSLLAGNNGAGFADGAGVGAKFNQPYSVAVAPNGSLVVADRLNHRVRVIDTNHVVSTLYGVARSQWFKPFPGWVDGAGGASGPAAAHDPTAVTVTTNGTVYVGELYYNLLRQATETGLGGKSNILVTVTNLTSTNIFVLLDAPTFSPTSGYFPFGVTVTVTSAAPVYYTTDGTEPTTNSRQVLLVNDVGHVPFTDNLRDLTSLRFKALVPGSMSATVGGVPATRTEFGIPRDFIAGSGARIVVPVVANLRTNARIQSFQYRVEVTPLNGAPPVLPYFSPISISTNDFVPIVTSAAADKIAHYSARDYTRGTTRGLLISASGTNANVDFQNFATTTTLVVPIDSTAIEGDTYRIEVLYPSATSDGGQLDVPVSAGPPRTITVSALSWLVGDVAPGFGYNAGEFGDGDLRNNDANSVLFASVGIRVPFTFTDAYNAMDAYPPEPGGNGDGIIDYFDWQVVLERSLRYDTANWTRHHLNGSGDIIVSEPATVAAASARPKATLAKAGLVANNAWSRGATLSAGNIYNTPSGLCEVPVSIQVAAGQSIGGLCFRIVVESADGAPAVADASFAPSLGEDAFVPAPGAAPNDIVCAWSMVPSSAFQPALQGKQVLGKVRFSIPVNTVPGQHYTIRFLKPSGGANLQTPVSFESIPGSARVFWTPNQPGQRTSDEWRVHFFGSIDDPAAGDDADPDGDSVPNWQEYLNGTDPTNP